MFQVDRLTDIEGVDPQELWHTKKDDHRMKVAIRDSVMRIRQKTLAGLPISYAGDDDDNGSPDTDCLIGIEHLVTQAFMNEVNACRQRCVRAVLLEQARQESIHPSARPMGWENIALASIAQTRRAAVRARRLGKLHRDSI